MKKIVSLIFLFCLLLLNSSLKAQSCNITLTSAPGTDYQTVCQNTAISNITYTSSQMGTGATVTGLPAGVNYTYLLTSNQVDIYGTPAVSGTFNYAVTYSGVNCQGATIDGTITVNPTPNAIATPSSQTICSGSAIASIALTSSTSGTTYTWTRDNLASVTGIAASGSGTPISGTLTNNTSAPITVTFTITDTANGCAGSTTTAAVLVDPAPDAIATPSSQTICSGSAITPIVLTSSTSGTTYTWTRDNTSSVTGIGSSGGGTPINGNLTNTTSAPITVSFTITPSANGCTGPTTTATVLVNPTPTAIATPSSQTICSGSAITAIAFTSNTSGTTYTWTRDNTSSVTGIAASGSGTPISGTLTNTTSAPVTVTFTITPTANGCTGSITIATVLVNPRPNVIASTSSQTICSGSTITPIVLTSSTNGTTYTWIRDNTSSVTGIAASGGGTPINGSLINATSAPVIVTFTITPTASGCTGPTTTATVLVNPAPSAIATPSLQIICSGTAITAIVLSSSTNGTTYTWTRDNTGTVTGIAANGTGTPISGTLTNNTSASIMVTFTITATANGCAGSTSTATVLVNPAPMANAAPSSQTICSGSTITAIVLSSSTSGTTYTWMRDNTSSVTGIAASGGGTPINGNLTNTTSAPVMVTFTITPSGNGCAGPATTATVLVNPSPTPNITVTPLSQAKCSGTALTSIVLTSSISGTTYTWTRDNTSNVTGMPASGSGSAINGSLTNNTSAPVTVTYTITPTANGCAGSPTTATVLVNPIPNVITTPSTQTICSGTMISTILLTGNVAGTVYNWVRNNTNNVTGIGNSGLGDISGSLLNTTSIPQTVTFTITPSYSNGGATCTGTAITASVLVNPGPDANATPSSQTICSANAITAVLLTSSTGGTTYAWTRDNLTSVIGLAASGSGASIAGTLTNMTSAPVIVTFTITPTADGCTGPTTTATVLVNPTPNAISTPSSQIICSGNSLAPIILTSNTGGTTYTWMRDNATTVTGMAASGGGTPINGNLTNTTSAPVTVTFTITPTANGCTGPTTTATVLVNPTPNAISTPSSQTICSGNLLTPIMLTSNIGGTTYAWTRDNATTVTGIAASGSGTSISGTFTNTTFTPIIVTFIITPSANGCTGPTTTATVLVNPTPNAIAAPSPQTICSGNIITPIVITSNTSVTTYTWTRDNTGSVTGIAASGSGALISGILTNTTIAPVTVTFTITPTADGCTGPTTTATVLVNPTPNAISTPSSQTICSGNSLTPIMLTGNTNGTTYTWTRDNATTVTGIAASGSGTSISGTLTNTTFTPIIVTFTITPTANGCAGPTTTATVLLNPTPNAIAAPSSQTICSGTLLSPIVLTSNTGVTTYTWTRDNTGSVTGIAASGSGALISGILTNTTFAPVIVTFTITPAANSCSGPPTTVTVLVNPTPNAIATASSQTICSGSSLTPIVLTGNISGTAFGWTRDNTTTVTGMASNGTGTPINGNLINTTSAPVIVTFTIAPTANGCTGPTTTATVLVNPTATVNPIASQVFCNGSSTTPINLSSAALGGTINYNWTNSTPSIGLAAAGTANPIPGFTATNATNAPVIATITVTPTYTNGGVSCVGTPRSFTITVNPTVRLNPVNNQVVCNRDMTATVNFSSTTSTGSGSLIVYSWTNSNTSIGLGPTGFNSIPGFVATNSGTVPQIATITITPTYFNGGISCEGTKDSFRIVVNPSPPRPDFTWPKLSGNMLCKGSNNINFNVITPAAGITYVWSASSSTVNIRDKNNPNTVISFPETGTFIITVVARNTFGALSCTDSVSDTIIVGTTAGITLRKILVKQPGNLLIYPDNSMNAITGYQWGYDSLIKPGSSASNPVYASPKIISGQVYQFFIPEQRFILANKLDTIKYAFWVLLRQGTCYTRVYYNGPYASFRAADPPVEKKTVQLKVVPNPNNGIFTIALSGNIYGSMHMKIYNALGQPVFTNQFTKTVPEIYERFVMDNLPNGLYFLEIIGSDLKKAVTRFIVQH